MDMQKEREAFLSKQPKEIAQILSLIEFCESLNIFRFKEVNTKLDLGVDLHILNYGWSIWQAAKAQAVPEGFILVNKKDLVKVLNCVTDDWLIDTDSFEEFKKIESLVQDEVNAMIEAQEPK